MNKKGITYGLMAGIVVIVFLVIAILAYTVSAGSYLESDTEKVPGYNKKDCPDMAVRVAGRINVEDSAVFDLEPSLSQIDINKVTVNNKILLKFGQEYFTFKVRGIDLKTNQELNTFEGSGILRGEDNSGISQDWSIDFKLTDNDCNKVIDNFHLKIEAELFGEDIGDVSKLSKLLTFEGGTIKWN